MKIFSMIINLIYEENSNGYYKLYDEADIFPTSNLIEFQKFYAEIKYLTIFPRTV